MGRDCGLYGCIIRSIHMHCFIFGLCRSIYAIKVYIDCFYHHVGIMLIVGDCWHFLIFGDQSLIEQNVESIWNGWSTEQQQQYETDNDCVGFDDCYDSIEQDLKNNMFVIGGIIIGIFVYQTVLMVLSCCLCTKMNK